MVSRCLSVLALIVGPIALAAIPVESGNWIEDTYDFSIQHCEGGEVQGNNFFIPVDKNGDHSGGSCSNEHLRAERQYDDPYTDGVRQFAGTFTINAMSGNGVSIKQTFGDSPFFILAVDQGGRLYSVDQDATIADGVANVGDSVVINTVHNTGNHGFRVYVNGRQLYTTTAPDGRFYDKLGAYATNSGTGDLNITWTDVAFWHRED